MLALIVAVSISAPSASDARSAYEAARAGYYQLKANAGGQRLRHNWLRTIAGFTGVAEHHPKSEEAARALYTAAELWNDLSTISHLGSDADQALANYERVASEHPSSNLADDALYATAVMYRSRRHDDARAARAAKQIIDGYPTGDMVRSAKTLMGQLAALGVRPAAKDETAAKVFGRREDAPERPSLLEVKRWSSPTYSRVAVRLTGAAQARSGWLTQPTGERALIVDIKPAKLPPEGLELPAAADTLVTSIKSEARAEDTVRLTLSLARAARQRIMVLENPYRVVIDVSGEDSASKPAVAGGSRAVAPEKAPPPIVVLDPGHGGKDVGATGPAGSREKDLALAIAKEAAEQLRAAGVRVVLTRGDDTFVSLEERTAIANEAEASLFVSIHLNATKSGTARGIETYYLDTTSNRYSLRLAARENRVSEDRVSDAELALADIATKTAVREAKKLAHAVQKNVFDSAHAAEAAAHDYGVKSSLFYVLLGARMPAVLVETGFISNSSEEKLLASSGYQRRLARAISQAVVKTLDLPAHLALATTHRP